MAPRTPLQDAMTKQEPSELIEPASSGLAAPHKLEESMAVTPPDGGWRAWLQVAGGFFVFFNIWCGSFPLHFQARKRE